MALVVLLKGINVGGYRSLRPSTLAKELKRFEVVNIGAAGTFVVRGRISHMKLRAELMRRLPFAAEVMICDGRDILRLTSSDPFAGQPSGANIIRFVGVLRNRPRSTSAVPLNLPCGRDWCLKILSCDGRFVLGLHRREMKAIGYLGQLETIFGVPVTIRSWSTILTIARILQDPERVRQGPVKGG